MSKTIRFSVSIEEDLIEAFDGLCRRRGWTNRSEAIRDAIRRQLVEQEWNAGEEVVGVITLLYDHHGPGLARKLTEIQHHALGEIISTTHVHIDAENCLEFLAVRGEARAIEDLSHRLIGLKGVKHGELTGTSTGKKIR
ncbi:nickel-responsive transcriptional regulator NikR [Candidatus Bipolaricaulota bacterium]